MSIALAEGASAGPSTASGQDDPFVRWEQIDDPQVLWRALGEARSYVDRVLILHRISQLKEHHAVTGILNPEELAELEKQLKEAKQRVTDEALPEALEQDLDRLRQQAEGDVLDFTWLCTAVELMLSEHPDSKEVWARLKKEQKRLEKLKLRLYLASSDESIADIVSEHDQLSEKVRQTELELRSLRRRLAGEIVFDREIRTFVVARGGEVDLEPYKQRVIGDAQEKIDRRFEELYQQRREQLEQRLEQSVKELQAKVDDHYNSLARAVEKAKQARRLRPRFEAQRLDEHFIADLIAAPGQVRAIFLEDSLLKDHLAYAEYKQPRRPVNARWVWVQDGDWTDESPPSSVGDLPQQLRPQDPESLTQEQESRWCRQLYELYRHPMEIDLDVTYAGEKEAIRHLKRFAPDIYQEGLGEDGKLHGAAAFLVEELADPERQYGGKAETRWVPDPEPQFNLLAEVEPGVKEQRLIEILHEQGAIITKNQIEVPTYHSWADIKPGKRFTVELADGTVLHYVPHYAIGEQTVEYRTHRLRVEVPKERIQQLREQLLQGYRKKYVFKPQDHVMVVESTHSAHPGSVRVKLYNQHSTKPWRWKKYVEAAEGGKEITYTDDDGEVTLRVRRASIEDIEQFGGDRYVNLDDEGVMTARMYKRLQHKLQAYDALADASAATLEVVGWTEEIIKTDPAKQGSAAAQSPSPDQLVKRLMQGLGGMDLPRARMLRDLYRRGELDPGWIKVTTQVSETKQEILHDAPTSERGVLRLERCEPRCAVEVLQQLGIAKGVCEQVPYQLIYRDDEAQGSKRRRGRVIAVKEEYASGDRALRLPDGHMVIHGTTGVKSPLEALLRLDSIHAAGGIKSIYERRRMGIGVETMSPLGDIASGIDQYVPCKIGNQVQYGSYIYYGMRPEILQRRDVFFSDRDFGGGHNRYPEYKAYAEKIGQENPYNPPSHESRQKHIDTGLRDDNEVYFRYEISWQDIDTIFVCQEVADQVRERVKRWKQEGTIPEHVRVVAFKGDPNQEIQERAREIAAGGR